MSELIVLAILGILMTVSFAVLVVPSALYLLRDSIQSRGGDPRRR